MFDRAQSTIAQIDPELWSELETWAAEELRSVNGQVEYLLRQAVQRRKKSTAADDGTPVPRAK